jgi:archaellum biogenesis ATPase FlaH
VNEYLRQGEKAVVIIDSLEYIMENNDPHKVMRMLFDLRDEIIMTASTLIISLDPDTIEDQKMAYLEREFNVVTI